MTSNYMEYNIFIRRRRCQQVPSVHYIFVGVFVGQCVGRASRCQCWQAAAGGRHSVGRD